MNTYEIEIALRADCRLSKSFEGVFPRDYLPKFVSQPTALVANTDSSNRSGEHWVAIYIENDKGEYFDSYGLPPVHSEFLQFLKNNCKSWTFNTKEIQSIDSQVCGQYCIVFLKARASGKNLGQIQHLFGPDTQKNDSMVRNESSPEMPGALDWNHYKKEEASSFCVQSCCCRRNGRNIYR